MFDEQLYLIAYNDFAGKAVDEALWIKAMTLAGGDKKRAKWHYIELRVDQLLRDPSLRHSASKKVRKPTHQSGAYMMWISILFCISIVSAAVVVDFTKMTLVLSSGFYLLDLQSLLFILPTAILFGIAATSWRTYGRCWTYTLGNAKPVSISEAHSVARFLNVMGNVSWKMGILGTLIGGALILKSLEQIDNVNDALTVAFLTLVYGLLLKLISYVAEQRVLNLYLH